MSRDLNISIGWCWGPSWQFEEAPKDLRRLDRFTFPEDVPYDFGQDNHYWWIAYDDKRPVGFAGMRVFPDNNFGFLCRAGVLKTHRGNSIHNRLIASRIKKARQLGLDSVITYTVKDNDPSSNNLIKKGFTLYHPEWPWAGEDVLYWKKDL